MERTVYVGGAEGVARIAVGERVRVERLGGRRLAEASRIVVDPRDPAVLYVATMGHGVFRSEDGGATWVPASRGLERPMVWALAQHPVTGELWAGTEPSAIYRSEDGGRSWVERRALQDLPRIGEWAFPNRRHQHHVKDLALDPADPRRIFGAVEEGWIVRSADGGETWANEADGVDFDAHSVALDPRDPRIVLATTGNGAFRSEDGGSTWASADDGLDRRYLSPIRVHPARPDLLHVCASGNTPERWFGPGADANSAFYRSEDQGRSWRAIGGPVRGGCWALAVAPDDPDVVAFGLHDGELWLAERGEVRKVADGLGLIGSVTFAAAPRVSVGVGKVAVVTGASRGIGAAIAKRLGVGGWAVAVGYHRDRASADAVVRGIEAGGGSARAVQVDVGDAGSVARMASEVADAIGPIDALVCNATAVHHFVTRPLLATDQAQAEDVILGEVRGVWIPARTIAPTMVERGSGAIVVVGSGLSRFAAPGFSSHGAGKAACDALVRSLAAELGPHGVRVNTVAPGPVGEFPGSERVVAQTPMGRLGRGEDVANAVALVLSDDAGFVTGAWVPVNGGLQMS
jgi:NAD(P)-dependent dehydrogenase (short-subunit alcohol dehydrogenase family)